MIKNQAMKSEQSINLNLDQSAKGNVTTNSGAGKKESYPISLYMLLVVDALLITSILFMTAKIIF